MTTDSSSTGAAAPTGVAAWRADIVSRNRAALLDAAIDLFLSQGYDRTSLEEIARGAGLSTATLYKHFPSKAALFGGIMARLWENEGSVAPSPAPSGDPQAGLLDIGRSYAALLGEARTVDLFRLVTAEAPRFPELGQELYERGKKPYLDRLHAYLSAEADLGLLTIEDVALAARQFLGMINDVVFWPRLLIPSLVLAPDEVARIVEEAVATTLARYGTRVSRPPA